MHEKKYSVYGIGNPLMDLIVRRSHDFLTDLGVTAGSMNLQSFAQMQDLLTKLESFEQVPGGSCANTLRGLAWLNQHTAILPPVYNGAVGPDQRGQEYVALMKERYGIKTLLGTKTSETGFSIIIVTPDFERTMFTYLGACREFESGDIDFDSLKQAQILHFNGYMWDTESQKTALNEAIAFARKEGIRVSFDLADPFVVGRNRNDFLSWVGEYVDILFGNREEFSILSGEKELDAIVSAAGSVAKLAVVKAGAAGCYVTSNNEVGYVQGNKVRAVDTVGAGDSFASGFLHALLREQELSDCAGLANKVAAGIVSVEGCNFDRLDSKTVFG